MLLVLKTKIDFSLIKYALVCKHFRFLVFKETTDVVREVKSPDHQSWHAD